MKVVKARTVPLATIAPKAQTSRAPSPRQLAAQKREGEIRRAIAKVKPGQVVVLEPSEGEKLATLRLSLKRVLADASFRDLQVAGRDGAFYIAAEPLPFARRGRRPASR